MTIQNSARGTVTSKTVNGPDRCHMITPNEATLKMASTAPNNSVLLEPWDGVFGWPVPVVTMSMSCWIR